MKKTMVYMPLTDDALRGYILDAEKHRLPVILRPDAIKLAFVLWPDIPEPLAGNLDRAVEAANDIHLSAAQIVTLGEHIRQVERHFPHRRRA